MTTTDKLEEMLKEKSDWLDLNAKLNAKLVMQLAEKNTKIEQQAALLAEAREVVEAVEWVPVQVPLGSEIRGLRYICPWCEAGINSIGGAHKPDCPRQAALAALDGEVKP